MKHRPTLIFYLLVIYVFTSFIWWSFLLLSKNADAFTDQAMLEKIRYDYSNNLPATSRDYYSTEHYQNIKSRFQRQKLMIIGEGLVFLVLLSAGSIKLWQTFRKEIFLAQQQSNFLLSITHELKSPLASMKLSLQTLLKRSALEDKFQKLVENSVEDVDRLDNMVGNILYAARMEDSSLALSPEMENISNLTNDILKKTGTTYRDSICIKSNIKENILIEIERSAFTSALLNLVENAIKYSRGKANVEVSLHQDNDYVVLEVRDNGIGIPEKERERVFKKFYRIGNEETRNTKGTGIGLFIVKRVVDLHKGKISISDNSPMGTVVRVLLPVKYHN